MKFVIVEANPVSLIGAGVWPPDGLNAYPYPFQLEHSDSSIYAYGWADEPIVKPTFNDLAAWAAATGGFSKVVKTTAASVRKAVDLKANPSPPKSE